LQRPNSLSLLLILVIQISGDQILNLLFLLRSEGREEGPIIDHESKLGPQNILLLNLIVLCKSVAHDGDEHVHHHNNEEERGDAKEEPKSSFLRFLSLVKIAGRTDFSEQHVEHEQDSGQGCGVKRNVLATSSRRVNIVKLNLILPKQVERGRESDEHDQDDDNKVNDIRKHLVKDNNQRCDLAVHL